MKHTLTDLRQRQALDLDAKIILASKRIKEWSEHWDGMVYVSFSGGKDSAVVAHLARQVDPTIPLVFSDTGLEYPELKAFAKTFTVGGPAVEVVRPAMSFRQVLDTYGYPVVDRRTSKMLRWLQNPSDKNVQARKLTLTGIMANGEKASNRAVLAKKWRYLVAAPFKISEKCCDKMKKEPLKAYAKSTGRKAIIGLMASDSEHRERAWLHHGCNAFTGHRDAVFSMPLGIWTEQDVLRYHQLNPGLLAPVYGTIEQGPDGMLRTTGERRTGCIFCCFGLQREYRLTGTHRFLRMKESHPKLYDYCMDDLGLQQVLEFMKMPTGRTP